MAEQNQNSGNGQPSAVVARVAPSPTYKVDGSASDYRFILRGADLVLVDAQNREQVFMLVGNMMSMESNLRMEFSDGTTLGSQDLFERAEMPEMDRFDDEENMWVASQSDEDDGDQEGNAPEDAATQDQPAEEAPSPEQAAAEQPRTLTEAIRETQQNLNQSVSSLNGEHSKPAAEINTNTSRDSGKFDTQGNDNPPPEEKEETKGQSEDDKKADEKPETPDNLYTQPPTPGQSENDNEFDVEAPERVLATPIIKLDDNSNTGTLGDSATRDQSPQFSGTAEPESMVQIYAADENGATSLISSVLASSSGNFLSPVPNEDLPEGEYTVFAVSAMDGLTATSDPFILDIDLTAPDVPSLDLISDTGNGTAGTAADDITNDTTPTFGGLNGEPGTLVTLSCLAYADDGSLAGTYTELGTVEVDEGGAWTYTLTDAQALPDSSNQKYSFKITATDKAGNTSADIDAETLDVTLDNDAPAAPDVVITTDSTNDWTAAPDNDSGSDKITNDNTPEFSGNTSSNAVIQLSINGRTVGTTTADDDGNWSLAPGPDQDDLDLSALTNTGELADGTYNVSAVAVDKAGNISPTRSFDMVIDTSAPIATVEMDDFYDSGVSNTDNITNINNPFLEGTGEANSRGILTIKAYGDAGGDGIDGNDPVLDTLTYQITLGEGETTWRQQLDPLNVRGKYTAELSLQDEAGNWGSSNTFEFTFDDTPPAVPENLDLDPGSDTGLLGVDETAEDHVTKDRQPVIKGTATASSLVKVYLTDENGTETTYSTYADENGDWSVPLTGTAPQGLEAGTYTVEATSTNVAGMQSERTDPLDPPLVIDIDTVAPTIALDSDSGLDAANLDMADHVTNNPTPEFSGTAEKGSSVTVTVIDSNGNEVTETVMADNQGNWSTGALSQQLDTGTYTVEVKATDIAGNKSAVTTLTPALIVDRVLPVVADVDLDQNSDTGSSNADNYTRDTTPELHGTITKDFPQGVGKTDFKVTITFTKDGGGETVFETTADATTGEWTLDDYGTQELSHGTYTVTVTATDHADNVSAPFNFTNLVIDTVAPEAPDLNLLTDSSTQGDWLTNADDVVIGGTVDPTDIITLTITPDNGTANTYTISADPNSSGTFDSGTGAWTFELPNDDENTYTIKAERTDLAGNPGVEATVRELTIDRSLDVLTVQMLAADDHGFADDGKLITNEDVLHFHGTVDSGSDVTVTVYAESDTTPGTYDTLKATYDLGTITSNFGNDTATWELDGMDHTITALGNGKYRVVVEATDAADNFKQATLDFEVDTVPPDASTVQMISTETNDTGLSQTDAVTSNQQPGFEGNCEAGARVNLVVTTFADVVLQSKEDYADADGDWAWSDLSTLDPGDYKLKVIVTDAAGNTSVEAVRPFTIDIEAPNPPSNFQLVTDSGTQGDLITSDNPVDISGRAEAGSRVTVFDGNTPLGFVLVADDQTWSTADMVDENGNPVDMPEIAQDGDKTYAFTTTDKAGNISATSSFTFELDRGAVLTDVALKSGHDTGDSPTDGITNLDDPVIEVRGEAGSTVEVTVYSDSDPNTPAKPPIVADVSDTDPNLYSAKFTDLEDGKYTVKVTLTDAAGNITDNFSDPFLLEVDTVAPELKDLDLSTTSDTGVQGDHITSDSSPSYSGRAEPGSLILLDVFDEDDNQLNTETYTLRLDADPDPADLDAEGLLEWTIDPQTMNLADGKYVIKAKAVDVAGNITVLDSPVITIDTVIAMPTIELDPDFNSGSVDDNCTNFNTPTLKGTAEPGTTLVLSIEGQPDITLDADQLDEHGAWSYPLGTSLGDDTYTVRITSTDKAGNSKTRTLDPDLIIDTTDPNPPTVILKDTGTAGLGNLDDDITNDPDLRGTYDQNDTHKIEVYLDDDTHGYEATLNADGTWELNTSDHPTLASSITAGTHKYVVKAFDSAGNSAVAPDVTFEYDVSNPDFQLVLDGAVTTDTLSNLTGNPEAEIGGTCDQGLYFTITANGEQYTFENPAGTTWEFTFEDPDGTPNPAHDLQLVEGSNLVTVVAEDGAGNKSVQTITINLDTQAPQAPTLELAATDTVNYDTNIDGDNITKSETLVLSGKTEPGSEIVLTLVENGITHEYTTTVDAQGNWTSQEIPNSHIDTNGDYTFSAHSVDATGNASAITELPVTIDRTTTQPSVELHNNTNSGDNDDNVTNIQNVLLKGTAEKGSTIQITVTDPDGNTSVLDTGQPVVANDEGEWSFQTSGLGTEDGLYNVTVTTTDVAGNQSVPSSVLPIRIDTSMDAPVIELHPDDDTSGRLGSTTDNITSGTADNELRLRGWADKDTETVEIYRGGEKIGEATIDSNTTNPDGDYRWTFTVEADTYADNTYTFTAVSTDAATNTASASLPITFDKTAPIKPSIDLHVDSDTGLSATDEITNLNWDGSTSDSIKLTGTVGEAGDGIGVFIYLNGGTEPVGQAVVVNRTWSFTYDPPNNGDFMPEGTYVFTAEVEDVAGNVSPASEPLEVVVDYSTVDPSINLVATSDSKGPDEIGGSVTDDITNKLSLDFDGQDAEKYAKITVFIKDQDGNEIILKETVADGTGHWEVENVDVDTDQFTQGVNTFYARATDEAGNVSNEVSLPVTLDSLAPVQTFPGLDAGSDTGRFDNDDITMGNVSGQNTHVTLRGELGETAIIDGNDVLQVRVYEDMGTHTAYLGTATIHSEGSGSVNYWTLEYDNITEGEHIFSIEVEDVAGNQTNSGDFKVIIDRTNDGTTLALDSSTNTYGNLGSNTDLLTSSDELLITGVAEGSAAVYITLNGNRVTAVNTGGDTELQGDGTGDEWYVIADEGGSWSIRIDASAYGDDTYQFQVHTEDLAGNTHITPLSIEVDRTAPVAQNADLAATSDLGRSNSDNITSADDIVLQGVLHPDDVAANDDPDNVAVYIYEANSDSAVPSLLGTDGTYIGQAVVTGNSWALPEFTPSEGNHYYYVQIVDNAGNESWSNDLLPVQIDHTLPESSIDLHNDSDSFDTLAGGTITDNRTNLAALDLTISSSQDTARIEIFMVDNGSYVSLGDATWNGSAWVFEVQNNDILSDGDYTFVSQATDIAGNVEDIPAATALTPADRLLVTIDRTPPQAPTIDLLNTDDSADENARLGSDGDEYTNAQSLTLNGTAAAGAGDSVYLYVSIDGGAETLLQAYDSSETNDGAWSFNYDSSTLGTDGAQTLVFRAEARDKANNPSETTLTVHVDQTLPDKPTIELGNLDAGSGSNAEYDAIVNEDVAELRGTLTEGANDVIVTLYRVDENNVRTEVANSVTDAGDLTITPDGNGNFTWAYDYTYGNDDDAFSFVAVVEDKAGNPNESDVYSILVDRSITPPTLDLTEGSDTFGPGTLGTNFDNRTNANEIDRITLSGTADTDCTVEIIAVAFNGSDIQEIVLATVTDIESNNTWRQENIDVSGLVDGEYTIIARATDQAGSVANSNDVSGINTILNMTLDRLNETVTIELDKATDSAGHLGDPTEDATDTDHITNARTITLKGDADLGTFVTVTDQYNNQVGTASTDAQGHWIITGIDTGTYGNGGVETITYTVSSVDTAGNRITQDVDVTFDKLAPSTPSIDLTDATNTGATNDGLTSAESVTLTGTISGEDAQTVEIYLRNSNGDLTYEGDASYDTNTNTWTYTTELDEQDTPYTYVARAIDTAGNYTDSADFDVTIDRSVNAPTIKLDASTNTDGGPVGTTDDDYTGYVASEGNYLNLKVEGDTDGTIDVYHLHSNPGASTFTVVDVNGVSRTYTGTFVGTSTYDEVNDEWSLVEFNASAYQDATTDLNFVAVSTDFADNKAVREYSMTLDDEAPANGIIDLATGSDSFGPGGTNEDNRTNEKQITLTGTLLEGADAVSVTVFDNGVELGQAVVSGDEVNGYKWTLVVGDEDGEEADWISEQVHDFTAVVEDNAGNTTPLQHLAVTIDRTLASPTFILSTDSIGNEGQAGDRLTNYKVLGFEGIADDDSTVEIYLGATLLGYATMDPNGTTAPNKTAWTFELNTEAPEFAAYFTQDKEYVLTAKATDTSGNTNSTNLSLTLDRTIHSTSIDLADGSDSFFDTVEPHTGTDEDNITNETILDLSGKIDADSTIELYIGGTLLAQPGNGQYDIDIDENGNWSVTVDVGANSFTTPGTSTDLVIRAEVTDNAGNFITSEQPVTVDRETPDATTISLSTAGHPSGESDTGVSSNDNITKGNPLVLTGTVTEGSDAISVYIYDNNVYVGEADIAPDNTWTYSYTPAEGDHTYTADVVDLAGNVNDSTASLDVTVDRTFQTLTLNLADASDSAGIIGDEASHADEGSDEITYADTITFNGVTDAGATVVLTISGTGIRHEVPAGDNGDGTGDWSITLSPEQSNSLQNTGYTASVTATDTAGNFLTETLPFTIDRDAPEAGIPSLTDDVDHGLDKDDNVTYATDLVLEGSLDEGASAVRVHVYRVDAGGENAETLALRNEAQGYLGEATVATDNGVHSWTFTSDALTGMTDDTYYYQVVVEDIAGNRTASDVQAVVVNTQPPTVTINLQDDSDTAGQHIGTDEDDITNAASIILDGTTDQLTNRVYIYNGDTLVTEAVVSLVDGEITWETGQLPVTDGQNETITYTARAENIAGLTTDADLDVTLDRQAPAKPTLALEPDPDQSDFPDLTNEEVITLNITGVTEDPNTTSVTLFKGQGANPVEVGEATWDANSGWTYTFNNTDGSALNDLGEGQQYFRVRIQDEAGNENWSDVINFEVDRTVAATTISLDSDSAGVHSGSTSDRITNAAVLEFSGDTDLSGDSSVKVYLVNQDGSLSEIDGAVTNPPNSNNGNDFTFTATEAATAGWANGEYTFRAVTTDNAGNQTFAETTITLDRSIAEPTFDLTSGASGSDTGRDTSDHVTSAGRAGDLLTFEGTSNEGDTVAVYIASDGNDPVLVDTFTADGPSWEFEVPATWVQNDNDYTFHVETEDKAGNTAVSDTTTVTVDRTTIDPTGMDLSGTSDTFYDDNDGFTHGTNADNITSAQTITLGGTVEEGSIVRLYIEGVDDPIATEILAEGDSTWSIPVPHDAIQANVAYTFYVETEDLAGNIRTYDPNSDDNNITVTIDRAAPGRPSITMDGTEGQHFHTVTGAGDADGVYTNDTTPTFTIANLEPGSKLDIRVDGESVDQPVIPENTGSYTFVPNAFSSDTLPHTITITAVDPAGNISETGTYTFTVDTVSDAPANIDLTDATNAGSIEDHITSDNDPNPNNPGQTMDVRPVIQGTAEGGAEITVTIGGTAGTATADADGNWTYQVTQAQAFGEGQYSAQVTATDYAGNVSQAVTYNFEIDNSVNPTGFSMAENSSNDTGFALDDQYTQSRTPAFVWTSDEDMTATVTVYKLEDNGTETEIGTFDEIASGTGQNTWSVPDGFALLDGDYRVEAVFTDTTANVSAMESVTLTVDNVGPDLSFSLIEGEDAGTKGDWKTNGSAVAGGLQITGNSESGARLYVYIDDVLVNPEADGYTEVTAGNGDWAFTLPASSLSSNGDYAVKVISEDQAGNKTALTHTLTVDLSVDPPGVMALAEESNSGTLADQITNDPKPTLTGQTEPGSTVTLYWVETDGNGLEIEHPVNPTEEASSITLDPDGDGTWSITADNLNLPDNYEGDIHFRAHITDRAENQAEVNHVVRIDTKPTNEANLTVALTLDSDTGEVQTDGYTRDTTPDIRGGGAEANTTVEVFLDRHDGQGSQLLGTAQANSDGDWVLAWPDGTDPLAEGDHTLRVRSYDVADNLSEFSDPVTVTVDVTPTTPTIALVPGDDTGTPADMVTSVSDPTFDIRIEPNSDMAFMTLVEMDGDTPAANGVHYTFVEHEPAADGVWQPAIDGITSFALDSGTYRLTVTAHDKAGNVSTHSETLIIDKSLPSFNMVVAEDLESSEHHGLYVDDIEDGVAKHIINSSTVTLIGSEGEAGSVITVYDGPPTAGGNPVGNTVNVDDNGDWTYVFNNMDTGEYTFIVRATDRVGNVFDKAVTYTVDLVDPTMPSVSLADGDDSAGQFVGTDEDNITNVTDPELDITFEKDTQVKIFIGDAEDPAVTIEPDANTTGSCTFRPVDHMDGVDELAKGDYTYKVVTTDRAGNVSEKILNVTIDPEYDATLTVDLHEDSDHGFETNDDLTNDRTPTLTGDAEAGSIVKVYLSAGQTARSAAEGMDINAMTCVNTQTLADDISTWEYTPTLAGVDAEVDQYFKVIVISEDAAGNTQEIIPELIIHLDTVPPSEPSVKFQELDENDDVFEDSMTADLTPLLGGRVEMGTRIDVTMTHIGGDVVTFTHEDGDIVYHDDTYNADDGTIYWTLQIPEEDDQGQGGEPLLNGPYTVAVTSTDRAGNETTHEEELLVQAGDPEPPTIGLAEASDSNILLDGVTKYNGVTENEDGETVDVVLQGYVESWKDVDIYQVDENGDATLAGTVTAGGGGLWQWAVPGDGNGQVADGDYTYYIECTYRNGTTYRSGPIIEMDGEVEVLTGYENFTVKVDSTPSPSGFELGEDPVTGESYDTGIGDDWLLPDENPGDLDFTQDDWQTYYASPTIRGTAEPGSTIQVQMLNPNTDAWYDLSIIPPTTDEDGNYFDANGDYIDDGAWSYTFNTLAEGDYQIKVIITDLAGNISESAIRTLKVDPNLIVPSIDLIAAEDTMVEQADIDNLNVSDEMKTDIAARLDGFSSDEDGITSVNNPVLTGDAEAGSRVKVTAYFNGSNIPCAESDVFIASGDTWSLQVSELINQNGNSVVGAEGLIDGSYLFKVTTVDLAGNEEVSSGLELTIDTETRAASIDMHQGSDHGPFGTSISGYLQDNITNEPRPTFTLYGDNGASYLLYLDGELVESGVFNGTYATYQPSEDIPDGDRVYKLITADQAGHVQESAEFEFTIDTQPVTVVDVPIDLVQDGGIQDDYITNVNNPTLRIQVEEGTWASISGAGFSGHWQLDGDGDGYVQFTVDPALLDGEYPVTVRFSDTAGNYDTDDNKTINLVIDTQAPATSLDLATISDLGYSSNDNLTAANDVRLTGSVRTNLENGATTALDDNEEFTITFRNNTTGETLTFHKDDSGTDGFSYSNTTGQWSLQCNDLDNATYTVSVSVEDSAGNERNQSMNFTVFDYDNDGGFPEPALAVIDYGDDVFGHDLVLRGRTVTSATGYEAQVEMTFHTTDDSVASESIMLTAQANGRILFDLNDYQDFHYVDVVIRDRAGNVSDIITLDLYSDDGITPPEPEHVPQTENIMSVSGTLDGAAADVDQVRLTLHGDTDNDGTDDVTMTQTVNVENGEWAHDFVGEMEDGDYSLDVVGIDTDTDTETNLSTVEKTFDVDFPEGETLDHTVSIEDGVGTDPVLSGTIDNQPDVDNVQLTVTQNGVEVDTVDTSVTNGQWEADLGNLADGDYSMNLEALDGSTEVNLEGGQEYDFTVLADSMQEETELYPEATTETVDVTPAGGEDLGATTVNIDAGTTTEYTPDI